MAVSSSQLSLLLFGLALCVLGDEASGAIINFGSTVPPALTFKAGNKISVLGGDTILRGSIFDKPGPISLRSGAVYVGETLIADNYNVVFAHKKPTYQKAPDGSLWWTNVKVGEPMTRAEIDKFEDDWPRYYGDREKRIKEALSAQTLGQATISVNKQSPSKSTSKSTFGRMFSFFPWLSGWSLF